MTVEDGCVSGGFGSAVDQWLGQNGKTIRVVNLGIPDNWIYQGSVGELRADCGFDSNGIHDAICALHNEFSQSDCHKNQHTPDL